MKKCCGLFFVVLVLCAFAADTSAQCTYHCYCKARCGSGPVGSSISNAVIDWGQIKTYHNHCLNRDKNADDCTAACSNKAISDPNWNNASFLCSKCPSGAVTAYASVATKEYKTAQTRIIENKPAVTSTTCTCPPTWLANMTNQDGGVTADGKCKKGWCVSNIGIPGPADGTPIGSWGFTWGNGVWVWGTVANGGAPKCVTITTSPAVCRIVQ